MISDFSPTDTIVALASAPGGAARGIVRVSGPGMAATIERVFARSDASRPWPPTSPTCLDGECRIEGLSSPFPVALYVWPGRRSYTGEPLCELHLAGSPPILEALIGTLCSAGARLARPGEFTLRAFLAGRIDLMQAEGVLGVIDSASPQELQTALSQLAGGLSGRIASLRSGLLDLLADLEAGLDFADEKLEFVSHAELVQRLQRARDEVAELEATADGRMRHAPRWRVVLAGAPNAGKSTLFNALLGRAAALVSEHRGTTRDYLEADLLLDGVPVTLCDTAGECSDVSGPDREAQAQRQQQWDQADLVVWCQAADEAIAPIPDFALRHLAVMTKSDLAVGVGSRQWLPLSVRTGQGLTKLIEVIAGQLTASQSGERQFVGTTAVRARESLRQAAESLDQALASARQEADQALLAFEIRETLDALGEIVGAVYTDDILDRVFSKFCIGK